MRGVADLLLVLILLAVTLQQNDGFLRRFSRSLTPMSVSQQNREQPALTSAADYFHADQAKRDSYAPHILKMVSVGGGTSMPAPPKKSVGFLISPSVSTSGDEMLIIQNLNQISQGENTKLGIIGTNDLAEGHKKMIELLSYALVLSGNHVFTSGGGNGTNRAVISGALRACNSDLLTVILPQSLPRQPPEMQNLLMRVANLIQQPEFDDMDFKEAATLCNEKILSYIDKLLVFAYHDSNTVLKSAFNAEEKSMEVIIFYLD